MKYTEGKVLFIVADKSCHGIPVGAKVTINEVNRSDYGFVTADNTQRWCREEEVSETNPKPLFKAGDRVVLNTTSPVREGQRNPLIGLDGEAICDTIVLPATNGIANKRDIKYTTISN